MAVSIPLALLLIILIGSGDFGAEASRLTNSHVSYFRPCKLFVFGDSYADTGNSAISQARSWKVPYGITFPGRPAGRFSDGRVFTDVLAKDLLGFKTPVAYRWRKTAAEGKEYGVNFATGGSGVFDTVLVPGPNMTTQIDQFELLIKKDKMYTKKDIISSLALVALSGNDYSSYLATHNSSTTGLPAFVPQVVNQLTLNLKRVHALGVNKVAVTALGPIGCIPQVTYTTNFNQCNPGFNQLAALHNQLLQQAVAKLNNETKPLTFVTIDFYTAFNSVIESSKFKTPLVPCCVGVNSSYSCGSVDSKTKQKQYTLCPNPNSAFFWDAAHPTQQGWEAVFSKLDLHSLV